MSKQGVVFVYNAPGGVEDDLALAKIVAKVKEVFAGQEGLRIHAVKDKAADTISYFLSTGELPNDVEEPEESVLVSHARRELELIGNDKPFDESIINAIKEFAKYGHSGFSASIAIPLLNDLLNFKNLTDLTANPAEWNHISEDAAGQPDLWQSARNPKAFSNNGGLTYYLVDDVEKIQHETKREWRTAEDDSDAS